MSRRSRAELSATDDGMTAALERACDLALAVEQAVSDVRLDGESADIRDLQRLMARLARESSSASVVLISALEMAERRERIERLKSE